MSEGKLLKDKEVNETVDERVEVRHIEPSGEWEFSEEKEERLSRRHIGLIERIKILFTGYSETESSVRFLYKELGNRFSIIKAKYDLASESESIISKQLRSIEDKLGEQNESLIKELLETKKVNGQVSIKIRNYMERLSAIDDSYSEMKDLYDQQVLDIQDLAQLDRLRKETALAKRNDTIIQKKLTAAENLVEETENHIIVLEERLSLVETKDVMFEEE